MAVDAGIAVIVVAVVLIFVASLAMLGQVFGEVALSINLGTILGPSWAILAPSLGHLGAS